MTRERTSLNNLDQYDQRSLIRRSNSTLVPQESLFSIILAGQMTITRVTVMRVWWNVVSSTSYLAQLMNTHVIKDIEFF